MGRTTLQIAQAPPLETVEQQSLFAWAELVLVRMPELQDMYAVPNGAHKSPAMARKFQREGLKAGVPDVVLPHARHGYHALYIEMKRRRVKGKSVDLLAGDKPSAEQVRWHVRLTEAGNCVCVAYGWEAAKDVLEWYLGEKGNRP